MVHARSAFNPLLYVICTASLKMTSFAVKSEALIPLPFNAALAFCRFSVFPLLKQNLLSSVNASLFKMVLPSAPA